MNHREMHHSVKGQIVYGPKRGKNKDGSDIIDHNRITIQIPCFDICDYYMSQFYKKFGIQLIRPSWEPHVTVISNQFYNNNKKASKLFLDRKHVIINYSHFMFWNEEHVWVAADCPEIMMIRNHYDNHTWDRGHFTIGKFHEKDVGKLPVFKKFEDVDLWKNYANQPIF